MSLRAQPAVTVTVPSPVILDGKPELPTYLSQPVTTVTAVMGPQAIHAAPPPAPKPAPGGGYLSDGGDWHARWSVEQLPDPASYPAGYYWLGAPSSADGTSSIQAAARQWSPDPGTPNAPGWHSFYPYKPSVVSVDHYLFGGDVVHHPKGVNFNAHFIEHMWLDWGSAHKQPFTWLIAAMPTDFPSPTYQHHLLDSGRNPDDVGFPRLSANDVWQDYQIKDNLTYRSMLQFNENHAAICARLHNGAAGTVHCKVPGGERPKMYIAIFNGAQSYVGQWAPGSRHLRRGSLDNTADQLHRYYVMGRRYGVISQDAASHVLVFEIRYWNRALSRDELEDQYKQLGARHQFDRYRQG